MDNDNFNYDLFDKIVYQNNDDLISEKNICNHNETFEDKDSLFCLLCNKELEKIVFHGKEWRFYGQNDKNSNDPNRIQIRKNEEKSIFKDVENMPFSDKIINEANNLFLEITKGQIFRGNSRKAIICACIFHSFKKLNLPQTQEKLIKIFGLNRKTSLKGMKFLSQNAPKNSFVHLSHITPIDLIQDIMDNFNSSSENKQEVIDIYKKIKNKSFKLNGSRPQSVGSGLVYYWILSKGINITLKEFAKKVKLSEITILDVVKEISDILNKYV